MTHDDRCIDCGGRRSPASGQRCLRCYRLRAALRRFARESWEIAQALEVVAHAKADNGVPDASRFATAALMVEETSIAVEGLILVVPAPYRPRC